jgi:hypothetical protein
VPGRDWKTAVVMRYLLLLWNAVYLHFGGQLYFSYNQDLDNPEVNLAYPWVKDLLYLFIFSVTCVLWLRLRRRSLNGMFVTIILLNVFFVTAYGINFYFEYGELGWYYLKHFKNLIMYGSSCYLFINFVSDLGLLRYYLKSTCTFVTVSLLVGILAHYFSGIQSISARLVGVYGNPNAVGFMALGNIGLLTVISERVSVRYVIVTTAAAVAGLLLSASLTAVAMGLLFIPIYGVFRQRFGCRVMSSRSLLLISIAAIGMVGTYSFMSAKGENQLVVRVSQLLKYRESDSLDVRTYRRAEALSARTLEESLFGRRPPDHRRTDSSLFDYLFNFGWVGLIVFLFQYFLLAVVVLGAKVSTMAQSKRREVAGAFACSLTLFLCSSPIQYQLEVFPTNFFTFSILASGFALVRHKSPQETQGCG